MGNRGMMKLNKLTKRQPEGDFVTLLDGDGLPVGFEPKIGC